jgi:hypothetical protein
MQKDLNLDDAGRMGHAAAWSESTLGMFNRQEGRLDRTFYRALHELQRLRKQREANLALVSQTTPVGQVPDLPSSETNNIHPPPPNPVPANPILDLAPTPQNGIHIVPTAANMQ